MELPDPIGPEDAALHQHRHTAAPLADTLNQNWIRGNPRFKGQPRRDHEGPAGG